MRLIQLCMIVVWLVLANAVSAQRGEITQAEVDKLRVECEARRQEELAPIRAQKTQACIDQQLRSENHCKRYYTTYGNVSPGPSGVPQQGYFYDLPECQLWLESREALTASRSRP